MRVGDTPFPETSEELRLQVLEVLYDVIKHPKCDESILISLAEKIILSLAKALTDTFPAVKRFGADIVIFLANSIPTQFRMSFKPLLKSLVGNANHQHSKTRSATLKAIGTGLVCIKDEYEKLMEDPVLPLLSKMVADRTAITRKELAVIVSTFLSDRIKLNKSSFTRADVEATAILLLLQGDEADEVTIAALEGLKTLAKTWYMSDCMDIEAKNNNGPAFSQNDHIEDGELELQRALSSSEETTSRIRNDVDESLVLTKFIDTNISTLLDIIIAGTDSWTSDSKRRYIKSLNVLINLSKTAIQPFIPQLLSCLSQPIRDDSSEIRIVAEDCCCTLGKVIPFQDITDLLIPRILGEVPGGDTSSHRTSALRVLTHTTQGISSTIGNNEASEFVLSITTSLTNKTLFEFREPALREATLLMIRALIDGFPAECKTLQIQRNILFCLLFLLGRCPGETDVVPEAAYSVLCRLAALDEFKGANFNNENIQSIFSLHQSMTSSNIQQLFTKHFMPCFHYLCPPEHPLPNWELSSPVKAAFVQLLTHCPKEAWVSHKAVLEVIVPQIQHKKGPEQGSTEANMLSYASVRGEEVIDSLAGAVDVRLSLIIALEELIKAGTSDWQCSEFIAASAEKIFSQALTPNLVWRVGRVEATVRKVALAACYAMLKAGAVRVDSLYKVAPELVPLITSHLDDHDTSPRHIGCLCLTVIFERLKGAFGDQAIHEMYPKLLKRLDDSSDAVRLAICGTLQSFLLSAPKSCYSGTTIDYMLDQLFIHLDDPDPTIQEAVLQVIVKAGKFIDKEIVLKKANNNRKNHRSPVMCDKVINEVQGYEILS